MSIVLIILILIAFYAAFRNADVGYTQGKGMFKNSDANLNDDEMKNEKLDFSDYDYYNKDKLK